MLTACKREFTEADNEQFNVHLKIKLHQWCIV
jgi:hypothetical protein